MANGAMFDTVWTQNDHVFPEQKERIKKKK
jgi:hypothetical protein